MESTVKQRLIEFIKFKDLSQGRFEKMLGFSNGFVNNISKSIGADKLQRIVCDFPELNSDWLITGNGTMLKPESDFSEKKIDKSVPFYEAMPVSAGELGLVLFGNNPIKEVGRIDIPIFYGCKAVFPIIGESMEPIIYSGDYIGVIEMDGLERIRTDKPYLIITKEERMVKFISECEDPEYIVCSSPNYRDFKVMKSDIVGVYLVKAFIRNL